MQSPTPNGVYEPETVEEVAGSGKAFADPSLPVRRYPL